MRKYESKHGEIAPDEEVKERAEKVKLMEAKPLSFFEKASFITVLAITLLSAHYFGIWTAIKSLFIFLSIIGYFLLLWDYVLVRYKKPKEIFPSQKLNYELPEFDFAELINKCREQPEKFIEEWKHKPIIVTGFACDIGRIDNSGYLINKLGHITKDFFGSKYEGMPAITIMDSYFGNSNETLGKFILNIPEAESLKINEMDKVKIQIFISELLLGYKESEISPKAIKYISLTGIMEEEKLTQKEDHVFIKRRKFYGTKEIFPSQEVNDELPDFDFVELIKECKDEPEKFIEEWKHKPIIVIGVVKEVGKEEKMNVIKMEGEKLFDNINAVAKFQLNIPKAQNFQIKEGDRVKIQVFISEIYLSYNYNKITYISVKGAMEEIKDEESNFLMVLPDEFQSIPTDSLRNFQVSYINNDTYKKSSIMLGIGDYDEVRHSHNYRFHFDSYLDSKLLKELYNIAYQREITIKGKRLPGVIFGNSFYHCEILIE